MLLHRWQIQVLGGLKASREGQFLTEFKSQKVAALLAYLAFYPSHPHSREALQTLLWPDDDLDAVRNRLRVSLSSLRRQLEPPDTTAGSVLIADRLTIRLNPQAFTTDVARFEEAFIAAQRVEDDVERIAARIRVVEAYAGDLLPGFYEEWVISERERLSQSFQQTLHRLTRQLAEARDFERALYYARMAAQHDSWREEAHRDVMRLYVALGQPSAALQQYEELKRTLQEAMGVQPASSTQQLAQQIAESLGHAAPSASLAAPVLPPLLRPSQPLLSTPTPAPEAAAPPEEAPGGRLPTYLTHFFGREQERTTLCELLIPTPGGETVPAARLVTLTGLGGNGKTRLAVAVAQQLRPLLEGQIWFVPLADLSDAALIPDAIISVLRLPRVVADPMTRICAALKSNPALLILDNFEHLAEDGAAFVEALLDAAPSLTCLITSRRTLGLPGEREFVVLPLPVPTGHVPETSEPPAALKLEPAELLRYAGIRLFVDRAQANRPDFQITPRNAAEVAALCRELEGIPLAIELAAARARVLTPAQMRAHLQHRFDLLVDRRADKDARHRSLWATIEWSYRLLPHPLRRLFAQLSQFVGGWSLDAAQRVCRETESAPEFAGEESDLFLLDALERLRIEALIETYEVGDEIRFRMLQTLREFAAEQLSPEEDSILQARFVGYFVELAEEASPHLRGAQQAAWQERLRREQDNLRAAFELCLKDPEGAEAGMRLLSALERFWIVQGRLTEARALSARVLAHPGAQRPTALRARALITAGTLHVQQDDYETAFRLYQESLETAQKAKDLSGEARALDNLGTVELRRGQHASAHASFERSLAMHRAAGDLAGIAATLSHLGSATHMQGDYRTAQRLFEESLVLHRRQGDLLHVATTLSNLGLIFDLYGEYETARAHYRESQAIHRELDNKTGSAGALLNLGILAAKLHDYESAHASFQEALALVRELEMPRGIALVLGNLGSLEEMQGRSEEARILLSQALKIQREIGDRSGVVLTLANIGRIQITQGAYEAARACLAESLEIARDLDLRRAIAEGLESFAGLADAQGQPARAVRLYSVADALRIHLRMPLDAHLRTGRETVYTRLRQLVGDDMFAAEWRQGASEPLEVAIALALTDSL